MKKLLALFIGLSLSVLVGAQPANYYNSANGLTGNQLKVALHNIIKGHSSIAYSQLWNAFWSTDNTISAKTNAATTTAKATATTASTHGHRVGSTNKPRRVPTCTISFRPMALSITSVPIIPSARCVLPHGLHKTAQN